ncbi:hypothetical protein V8E53_007430 [Lactarius tabidus]
MGESDRDRYIHLKEISVDFIKRRPTSVLELVFKDDAGVKYRSSKFKDGDLVHWNLDTYVRSHTCATLTIQRALFKITVAQIEFEFKPNEFGDYRFVGLEDSNHRVTLSVVCEGFKSLADVTRVLGSQARTNLAPKVLRFLKLPQLAALPPSSKPYPAIHWLNDDILLNIFNCYRLDDEHYWTNRLGWGKLSHTCQRWRHLIYECASHLGMHIRCTIGKPIVDTLDHLPPLPLFVRYYYPHEMVIPTEHDELGIYHALRLHDRVQCLYLRLPPSILYKVLLLMDEHFPILEDLFLEAENCIPFTLPKAFVAPNLRYLALSGISPPRRLRFLTSLSTVSLVALTINNIENSSYFRPRVLIARLSSLFRLEKLDIGFSMPIPGPSTERELLGEQRAPVTLSSLKTLWFKGVSAYLESLVAQITVPLLERLEITLFNQIVFTLPHLDRLINITDRFKLPEAVVLFDGHQISVTTRHSSPYIWDMGPLFLRVRCQSLDWQIDCAAQICSAIIPTLSGVERLRLEPYFHSWEIPTEFQNGAIDSTAWHELLRPFFGVKELYIDPRLSNEISRALQVDEVAFDPGFLPNLQYIASRDNLFSSFIDTRRGVGRPVEFVKRYYDQYTGALNSL